MSLGNISKITAPGNAVTLYEYDLLSRLVSQTAADGAVMAYTYDALAISFPPPIRWAMKQPLPTVGLSNILDSEGGELLRRGEPL